MPDTFTITVVFIALVTLVAAIVRRFRRDKCLKDFSGYMIVLERTGGEAVAGSLRVENTGLEFIYADAQKNGEGAIQSSYILYKNEYPNIGALIRFHSRLSAEGKKKREKELKRTYHPKLYRRTKRKLQNLFKAIRDSLVEVFNLLIARAKKSTPAGILTSQDKYISQMKSEMIGAAGTSYEPLLERYIGHLVVLELLKGDTLLEYHGVLKDYTAEFVEIMDVDYKSGDSRQAEKADLVVLRKYGAVRHLGE